MKFGNAVVPGTNAEKETEDTKASARGGNHPTL